MVFSQMEIFNFDHHLLKKNFIYEVANYYCYLFLKFQGILMLLFLLKYLNLAEKLKLFYIPLSPS